MSKTIIMLHGMGGDINTMSTIGKFCNRLMPDARFHSIEAPIDLGSNSERCLGWFEPPDDDKRELERSDPPKFTGIDVSLRLIHDSIDRLIDEGRDSSSIYLLGHSQGGAVAITTGLTYPKPLGGICTIAGYLAWLPTMRHNSVLNWFMLHHNVRDEVVGFRWATYAQTFIQGAGHNCEVQAWEITNSPHFMHKRQLESICQKILAK